MALQHLRSSTANKRPTPAGMSDGQLALNTNDASPGLFFKDSNGALVKVGPVHVGTTAPNATPGAGGSSGNAIGEQWLDTAGGTYVFKVWDGSAWRSESGTFVDVNGDVMTGALGIIAGSAGSPGLYFSGDTNTGLYSPGADQVAISTNSTGRLFVDASGNVGVGSISTSSFQSASSTVLSLRDVATSNVASLKVLGGAGAGAIAEYGATNGIGFCGTSGAHAFTFYTNSAERLRITAAGLVGVGTSAADTLLHLALTSSPGNKFRAQGANNTDLRIGDHALNNGGFYINSNTANQDLRFQTQGTDRVTIDSSGRVGIGSTALQHLCQIGGTLAVDSYNDTSKTITLRPGFEANANGGMGLVAKDHSGAAPDGLGIYGTDGVSVHTANAGSFFERFRVDTSGRLLVGTSSTSANTRLVLQGNSGGGGGAANLHFSFDGATPADGSGLGFLIFGDNTQSNGAWINAARDGGTWSGSSKPTRLVFSTTPDSGSSPVERLRIDSTGRCFFNTTASPSTTSFGTSIGTVLAHSRDTSTGAVAQIYGSAGEFRIIGSGNAQNTNNSYGAISDQSLKTDISDAGSQWDDIKGITVRKFKLIGTDNLQIGVVAQECELVSPGLVEDTVLEQEDGTTSTVKAVKYSVLYMKAVKALQEAMERIEQLEQRLAAAGI